MVAREDVIAEAQTLQEWMAAVRHELHRHPETGFDLAFTKPYVRAQLTEMGYDVQEMGKAGLVACIGSGSPTILLRADMDALAIQEESGEEFASETPGRMHGCGHDMHTAMLLGAARLLKAHEADLAGTVKLEFQPAEEIFQGSPDMLAAGLLENPAVDAAFMIHVLAGMELPLGFALVPSGGVSAASCEQYHITVQGKGGHGSMPSACIDPITAAAHIHLALQEINAREMAAGEFGVFTTGRFAAGEASNVIPDVAEMWGTIRTADPENATGAMIKERMAGIVSGVAAAYRCTAQVEFFDYSPCMLTDGPLADAAAEFAGEVQPGQVMRLPAGSPGSGSEDFAFVSHCVPTVGLFLSAGSPAEGYCYGQHHPRVRFSDEVLWRGAAIHTWVALRWLEEAHRAR